MRCKKHPTDLSSGVGVCASCLRERLFAVMAAQAQKDCRKSDSNHHQQQLPQPPPISFPRSVSPYISRRKSDNTAADTWQLHQQQRFYSTPQLGPTGSITVEMKKNKKSGRFSSLFKSLFRSKSDKIDSNRSDPIDDTTPSWLSTIVPGGRRKKQIRTFSLEENAIGTRRRNCRYRDRGMSPARHSDDEEEDDGVSESGYSSKTPRRTPAAMRRRGEGQHSRNVSGLTFCLSPLVRASPGRNWNIPAEMAEARAAQAKPHLSTAASFCKNRSRKLADFGRYSSNH